MLNVVPSTVTAILNVDHLSFHGIHHQKMIVAEILILYLMEESSVLTLIETLMGDMCATFHQVVSCPRLLQKMIGDCTSYLLVQPVRD